MKTRQAQRIIRSVERGTAIYPRHILRAACSQLMLPANIGGCNGVDLRFWPCGPIAARPHIGRWIPDIINECLRISKIIGVPVETADMNGAMAVIKPGDTNEEAYDRWRTSFEVQIPPNTRIFARIDGKDQLVGETR